MFENLAAFNGGGSSLDTASRNELTELLQTKTGLTTSQRTRMAALERKAIAAERATLNGRVNGLKKAGLLAPKVLGKLRDAIRTASLKVGADGTVSRADIHVKLEALEELQHSIKTGGLVDYDETGRPVALSYCGKGPASVLPLTSEMVKMAGGVDPRLQS